MKHKNNNSDNIFNKDCPFCQGTGIAKYFDMNRMSEVGVGSHELGYLCDNFGGESPCPECLPESELLDRTLK